MAVLGIKDNFNRDPKKMGRFWNSANGGGVVVPRGNVGVHQLSDAFHTTNIWTTVTTASSIVANQSYTIYNVSGASGFLIHAYTNATDNAANNVTFTVTVDGIASTIAFGASSASAGYYSGWLGQVAGGRMDQDNFQGGNMSSGSSGVAAAAEFPRASIYGTSTDITVGPMNIGSKVIDYSGGGPSLRGIMYAQGLDATMTNPLSCTRFENSLTVAYSSTVAIAASVAADRRAYGALIKLDG